jgi:hypothetical protein
MSTNPRRMASTASCSSSSLAFWISQMSRACAGVRQAPPLASCSSRKTRKAWMSSMRSSRHVEPARASLQACSSPDRLADGFNEFVFVGELACLELGIELLAAHGQLEAASCGGNHDEVSDDALVTRQEFGRQTDSLGFIVSKGTIFERDIHGSTPDLVRRPPARPCSPAALFASDIIVLCRFARKTSR